MKKLLFMGFLFPWTLGVFQARGQSDSVDAIFARSSGYPIETVYMHCNSKFVPRGDSLWWAAYVFEGGRPTTFSTNLYVDLVAPDGRVLQQRLCPILGGGSFGLLAFADSLSPGVYWVRAYTRYQLNFDSANLFTVPVTVVDRQHKDVFQVKVLEDSVSSPQVAAQPGIVVVATTMDSLVSCHLQADSASRFLGRPLDLVLASYHVPLERARVSLTEKKQWADVLLPFGKRRGPADILIFCRDSLIDRVPIDLGAIPSPRVEVSKDTLDIAPGGYNTWTVRIKDFSLYNCSVSVSDADESVEEPLSIDRYGTTDPWNYDSVAAGRLPVLRYADTAYLSWTGRVQNDRGAVVRGGELIVLASKDSSSRVNPSIAAIDAQGRFDIKHGFFFDSMYVSYQLNTFQDDPASKKVRLSFDGFASPGFALPQTRRWRDTTMGVVAARHWDIAAATVPPGVKVKVLPEVLIRASALKELDKQYARGLFTEPTQYAFDLRNDKTVTNIWMYLRKNLPTFRGGLDVGTTPSFNDKQTVFYVDGELKTLEQVENYWFEELAYVKAYDVFWVDQTGFMKWVTKFQGFTLDPVSKSPSALKIPNDPDYSVVCIYTRQGKDVRTGWKGLKQVRIAGYSPIVNWTPFSNNTGTLYWNPAQGGNTFKVRFRNRAAERYRICIEGVSQDGRVVHYEDVIPGPSMASTTATGLR